MTAVRVLAFDGLIPRKSPSLLGDNFAQTAENVKLYSGELRYWRGPVLAYTPPITNARTLHRLYNSGGASVWLLWTGTVDVAVGPVADTTDMRIYFTGNGTPKKTNYVLATAGAAPYPTTSLEMGVPKPSAAPVATLTTAGTGTAETRAYVFTQVSTFGTVKEEGKPSDPVSITLSPTGATVTIGTFPAVPAGAYNITHRRIYRTVVGAVTVSYQFVAEIPVATASYADALTTAQLGEVLSTAKFDPPPSTLTGLVALPSGALAGFVGNTVYFSEPYYPHAWPLTYPISLPAGIVGLAVVGSSVVVMTDTSPFFIHGGVPGEMYVERIALREPCLSRSTIATDEDGVIYASPNGLVGISPDGRGLLTTNLFTADEWKALTPATMKSAVLQGRYIGVFPNEIPARAMILSRGDIPALSFMQLPAAALHVDATNATLFYVHDTTGMVHQLDADENQPLSYQWTSKRWHLERAATFGALRMDAAYSQQGDASAYNAQAAAIAALNAAAFAGPLDGALNTTPLNTYDINGSALLNQPQLASTRTVQVVITGDGEVVANLTLTSLDAVRIPPFKARELEFSIYGNINVRSIHMATTMDELKQ